MKRALFFLGIVFMCFSLGGCGRMIWLTEESKIDYVEKYMEEKYGESFEFVDYFGGEIGKDTQMMHMTGASHPDEKTIVEVNLKTKECRDSYVLIQRRAEICNYVEAALQGAFPGSRVMLSVPDKIIPQEYSITTELTGITEDPHCALDYYIFLVASGRTEHDIAESLRSAFQKNSICGSVHLCVADTEASFQSIEEDTFQEAYATYSGKKCMTMIDDNYALLYENWEN